MVVLLLQPDFLDAIALVGLLSAGYRNRYRHPIVRLFSDMWIRHPILKLSKLALLWEFRGDGHQQTYK
jgi:hypothetical protein